MVVYAVFGTSRQLIVNPDAATCAMVAAIVAPLAAGDPALYTSLAVSLAALTGLACIIAGFLRLGFLADFLGKPVLVGFMNGIAISIVLGQIGKVVCCRRCAGCSNGAGRSSGLAPMRCFLRSGRRLRRASRAPVAPRPCRTVRCHQFEENRRETPLLRGFAAVQAKQSLYQGGQNVVEPTGVHNVRLDNRLWPGSCYSPCRRRAPHRRHPPQPDLVGERRQRSGRRELDVSNSRS
jgi:hypothetical protein